MTASVIMHDSGLNKENETAVTVTPSFSLQGIKSSSKLIFLGRLRSGNRHSFSTYFSTPENTAKRLDIKLDDENKGMSVYCEIFLPLSSPVRSRWSVLLSGGYCWR